MAKLSDTILIYCLTLIIFLNLPASYAASVTNNCNQQCSLLIRESDYRSLKTKMERNAARLIYLQVNQTYLSRETTYAWSRSNFGEILMALPADFQLINLYLPVLFQDYIYVHPIQKPNHCFTSITSQCQQQLIKNYMVSLPNNGRSCPNYEKCNIVCSRRYDVAESLDQINLECCWKTSNETKCTRNEKASPYIIAFRYISILVSCALGASLAKWTLKASPALRLLMQMMNIMMLLVL